MKLTPQNITPSKRMPKPYVQKFFDADQVVRRTEAACRRTEEFVAQQLSVSHDQVEVRDGEVFLSEEAYRELRRTSADDSSFLATGGTTRAVYELVEMGYNDIMSGSVGAAARSKSGLLKRTFDAAKGLMGEPAKKALRGLTESGALKVLGGIGIAATAGIGLWLGSLGKEQLKQALVRQDAEQAWNGARSLFLGAESAAASLAIAGQMCSGLAGTIGTAVARTVAAPFACVHGVIDVAQGVDHLRDGVKIRDGLRVTEGLAEIGMGIGWLAAAFCPVPAVVASAAACLATKLGVSLLRSRRAKKAKQEELQFHLQDELQYIVEFDEDKSKWVQRKPTFKTLSSAELYPQEASSLTGFNFNGGGSLMQCLKNSTLTLATRSLGTATL